MAKLSSLIPHTLLPSAQATKRLIHNFAEESGMVYFGYVSQRSDDHHIVRGLTVSNKHVDDHYCIGTYEGYDIMFVERSDNLRSGKRHIWHILEFDLRNTVDIPHIFIGSSKSGHGFHELLETKYPAMQPVSLGATGMYPPEFSSHFSLYVIPALAVSAEQIVPPETAKAMSTHFKGLVMEIADQSLYVYSEQSHLTADLLTTMLQNGRWLAKQIDQNSRQL
jgi:hypothetical protein